MDYELSPDVYLLHEPVLQTVPAVHLTPAPHHPELPPVSASWPGGGGSAGGEVPPGCQSLGGGEDPEPPRDSPDGGGEILHH